MKMFEPSLLPKLQDIPTPYYYYDLRILDKTLTAVKEASKDLHCHIHYALKANANDRILQKVKAAGLGIDTVSGQEIEWAIQQGFKGDQIAFAGVGKTDEEIKLGLKHKIFTFNVESLEELKVIDSIAGSLNQMANIAIRVNPNVNAKTHHYITTGLEENKFGLSCSQLPEFFELLKVMNNITLKGLHFHIGSQVRDMSVFKVLCNRVNELQKDFRERNIPLEHINLGGGLGINYENPDEEMIPNFKEFFTIFEDSIEHIPHQKLHFELGRSLVGQCAALISKVLYVKKGVTTVFVILDAGMTELIRPALYQAYHRIQNLNQPEKEESEKYDVVGPICESADCFGKAIPLPPTVRGDLIAIRSTGAYGQVMSSQYNLRKLAKTIYYDQI